MTFILVVGAYPIHTLSCVRYYNRMPSQLRASASAGPMFLKTLRNVVQKKNNLALSDIQQTHIEEHLQQFQKAMAGIRWEFRDIRQIVRAQTYRHADTGIAQDLEIRRYMAKLRLQEVYMKHLAAILSVLTEEQRAKIRNRGLALLLLYSLGTEFQKLIPAPHTQKFTAFQFLYIDHTVEPLSFPEQPLFERSVQEHLKIPLTPFLQHQDILRI